jgi:putative hydrolase of the HAD superfamily
MDSIKAIIFDYAGVLSLHQPEEAVRRMETLCGVSGQRFQEAYWGGREVYDRGEQDGPTYWRAFAGAAGCTLSDEQVRALIEEDTASWVHLNPVMVAWLRRLHAAGARTALLSNMGRELREYVGQHFDWCQGFAHQTFSCDVRRVKPEPDIYLHCLEGLGVAPSEALFIDDREVNIRAAERLGLRGLLFTTAEDLASRLPGLPLMVRVPLAA